MCHSAHYMYNDNRKVEEVNFYGAHYQHKIVPASETWRKFLFRYVFCTIKYGPRLMLAFIHHLNKTRHVSICFAIDNLTNKKLKGVRWRINAILIFFYNSTKHYFWGFFSNKNYIFFLFGFWRTVLFYNWLKNNEKCWLFMITVAKEKVFEKLKFEHE